MNIVTNIELSKLANSLIEKIKDSWKSPFTSPVVIFSDSKLEQWFKFYWMKRSGEVLMNLDMVRLDTFLLECVGYEGGVLREELLRDMMIIKLVEKDDNGDCYYKSLGSSVVNYLAQDNGVNEAHLFDFASQMAHLFLDYEITRPGEIIYEKGNVEFGKDLNSEWQQKLYNDIIGTEGVKVGETTYKTLFQAYRGNDSNVKLPDKYKDREILLFGFSGIGELHREILKKAGGNITIYLQTGNIANEPFKKWSKAGYDHYKNYCNNAELDEKYLDFGADKVASYKKCPSKLREIEVLHSSICKLIKDGAAPQDILVVAPNIGDYRTAISQVFDQNKGDGEKTKKGEQRPLRMPYVITDYVSSMSYVAEAVNILVGILYDGKLSRQNIFPLLRNPLVQHVRGISNDEVTTWLKWVEEMNIYRDRGDKKDWENAKQRLLVARLTTQIVNLTEGDYEPYENLETQNDASLNRFISFIDDLYEWCGLSQKNDIDEGGLKILDECITSFTHRGGDLPEELEAEALVYSAVKGYINHLRRLYDAKMCESMPTRIICFGLCSKANGTSLNVGKVFIEGVTFSNIVPNRVMSAKHLFMIGMDSKSFPRQEKNNVLDIRVAKEGEHNATERALDTFLCLLNAAEKIHISYVHRDLKKDDQFYPATPVQELIAEMKMEVKTIGIDETRDVDELFTHRELRNKANYERLISSMVTEESQQANQSSGVNSEAPDRVSLYQLRQYLEDPFVAYANRLFGGDEEDVTTEDSFFEPQEIDTLMTYNLRKEYVSDMLKGDAPTVETIVNKLLQNRFFTDKALAEKCANVVVGESNAISEAMQGNGLASGLLLDQNATLECEDKGKKWLVTGRLEWHKFEENKLIVVELSNKATFMKSYVTALVVIAQKDDEETEFKIELHSINKKGEDESKEFSIRKNTATKKLKDIYKRMFSEKYHKCVLIDSVLNGTNNDKYYGSLGGFINNKLLASFGGAWAFFQHKDMFNAYKDIGYDEGTFVAEYQKEVEAHGVLIKFVEPTTKE